MVDNFKKAIREQRAKDEQKYKEGYGYKVQYLDKTEKFFKEKPMEEDLKNSFMVSNLIIWD